MTPNRRLSEPGRDMMTNNAAKTTWTMNDAAAEAVHCIVWKYHDIFENMKLSKI